PLGQMLLDNLSSKLIAVLRHEKHPKGRIKIQLLGCSSAALGRTGRFGDAPRAALTSAAG
ncbi:hypothetical protein, partial [Burkholderia sp. YIM B11467]